MSNRDAASEITECTAEDQEPTLKPLPLQPTLIGPQQPVGRALPNRQQRLIGPWCFLDRIGPMQLQERPLDVPPHPHMGLQTVTWLLQGEMLHRDSLGTEQYITPGQLNLMTAGRGIAHSEQSAGHLTTLSGVQFWIALPEDQADCEPAFEHHSELPEVALEHEARARILVGRFAGEHSPATVYSHLSGVEIIARHDGWLEAPLEPELEYGVLLLEGQGSVEGHPLSTDTLIALGGLRRYITLDLAAGSRVLLFGGEPMEEELLLWWNFVGRSTEEIQQARTDWEQHQRFGEVPGYLGPRLEAPPLTGRLK